jgi:general secretion pathway protein D
MTTRIRRHALFPTERLRHHLGHGIDGRRAVCATLAIAILAIGLAGCAERKTYGETYDPLAAYDARKRAADEAGPAGPPRPLSETATGESPTRPPIQGVFKGSGELVNSPRGRGVVITNPDGQVTLNFGPTEIRELVDAVLGQTLGLTYSIDDRVRGTVQLRTSQPIPRSAVLPMLEQALQASGAALIEANGAYRVVPLEAAQTTVPPVRLAGGSGAGLAIEVIPLRYASAATLAETLKPFVPKQAALQADTGRNILIAMGTGADVRNLADIAGMFDVDYLAGVTYGLFKLDYAEPKAVVAELQAVFGDLKNGPSAGAVRFVPLERLNSLLVVSAQPIYIEHARTWIARLDRQGDGEGRQVYVYRVQNRKASELAAILDGVFGSGKTTVGEQPSYAPGETPVSLGMAGPYRQTSGGGTQSAQSTTPGLGTARSGGSSQAGARPSITTGPAGPAGAAETIQVKGEGTVGTEATVRVIADESHNALTILATAKDYHKVEQALKKLDVVPLQVLIEATIAEVTLNDKLRYGLEWFLKSGKFNFTLSDLATGAVSSSFPGFSAVAAGFGGDVHVVLDALDEITKVRVLSSPQMMVLNNRSAILQVGDQVPILTRSAVSVTDPAAPVVNSIEYHDTGVILRVTPRVNESGLVTMEIRQEVSDVVNTTSSTIDSPTIQQRFLESSVAVGSGETIALGGLIQDRRTDGASGIPLLSQIPIFGNLFKTTTNDLERTELLVLITPRVIRDGAQARDATQELRDRLTSLKPKEPPSLGLARDVSRP